MALFLHAHGFPWFPCFIGTVFILVQFTRYLANIFLPKSTSVSKLPLGTGISLSHLAGSFPRSYVWSNLADTSFSHLA